MGPSATLAPEEEERIQRGISDLEADLTSRSVLHYRIAYLIAADEAVRNEVFSEDVIVKLTGANVFHEYEEFAAVHSATPFEIVLLHTSMYDNIDREWGGSAFQNNVIFMGLDVSIGQLAELFGNNCFTDVEQTWPEEWHWVNVLGYQIDVENPDDYEAVKKELLTNCGVGDDVSDQTFQVNYHVETLPLVKSEWIDTIPSMLTAWTYRYGLPNRTELIPLPTTLDTGKSK